MRQQHLCDYCFKKGHIPRFCRANGTCTVEGCQRKHHHLLHRSRETSSSHTWQVTQQAREPSSNKTPATVGMATSSQVSSAVSNGSARTFLNVVPVIVSSGDREIPVYAFLDQGSTTILCNSLLKQLDVKEEDARYTTTTINKTSECCSGKKVKFKVSSLDKINTIELEEVYAVESLPVTPNHHC